MHLFADRFRTKPHLRSTAEILRDNLLIPFHALMLACAIVLLIYDAHWYQLTFIFLTLMNAALRIGYDISARNAVHKLDLPDLPHTVLRNGEVVRCARKAELQTGDILALHRGDIVTADCEVIAGEPMAAESLLTGNSHAVRKTRGDTLYAESRMEVGSCCVRVLQPSAESLAAHMAEIAPPHHARRAEIDVGIHRLVVLLGSVSVFLAVCKAIALYLHGEPLSEALPYAATMVTSLIPVTWLLLSSVSLFLGAHTLRRSQAAARDLFCVETLARADVICFDKTGTVTRRAPEGGLREEIDALDFFRREGIALKILSGDTVESVAAVLEKNALTGPVLDCRTVADALQLEEAALTHTGFAHATAAQKSYIVRALRHAGHTVAMVGDGANDVAALRAADCSVSFGSGADEVRAASQIVLLKNDLSLLPEIVLEGRRVINNITRTGELFVKKTLCSFVLYLLMLVADFSYPILAEHWTVLNLFCVIIPAAVLATERQHQPVHGRFFSNVLSEAAPGALLHILYIVAAVHLSSFLGLSDGQTLTLCCCIAGAAGLGVLWHICCFPLDRLRLILCTSMTVLLPIALFLMGPYLHLSLPTPVMLMWLLLFAVFSFPLMHLFVRTLAHIEHALQLPTHAAHSVKQKKKQRSAAR